MPYTSTWNNPYMQPGYQPTMPLPPQQIGYQAQQGVKKVNGPQSALQYPVAPNTQSDPLFDFNGKDFYIVSADSAGFKTLETFGFFKKENNEELSAQVTRAEFDALVSKVNNMEAHNGIHGPIQPTATDTTAVNNNVENQA